MAAASGNGGRRSSAKIPGKTEKQSRKTQGDDSDKICGFHPLRSLRNIFFGYRTRGRPSIDEEDAVGPSAKAKSTDDIVQQQRDSQQQTKKTAAVVHAPVTASNSVNPVHRSSRTSIPMVKQLSKSADNLMSPADWIPAPHGIPSVVTSPSGSEDSSLNASMDEIDNSTALDPNSVDEFFTDKWSQVRISRTRAFSSGDADETSQEMTFDLDSVNQTKALDVSVAKDRIAIKPKNKRATVAMQQKMLKAETTPRPTKSYHLQSLTEAADEDEDEGKKGPRTNSSSIVSDAVADGQDQAPATPDRPIRREKKLLLPVPNKTDRMTINITPDMLTGARKKATDRGNNGTSSSSSSQSSATNPPRANIGPPPPTCPKKRRTICEPEGGTSVAQEDKKKENSGEEPGQNGAALRVNIVRRPLLSLKEDEVVAEEEGEAAKPKAPPRVKPKTRPKTMMHSPGAPHTKETEPEWLTSRANKKNALID